MEAKVEAATAAAAAAAAQRRQAAAAAAAHATDLSGETGGDEEEQLLTDFMPSDEEQRAVWARRIAAGPTSSGDRRQPSAGGAQHGSSAAPGCTPHMTLPFGLLHHAGASRAGAGALKPGELDMLDLRLEQLVTPGCVMALVMQFYGSLGEMFECCPALRDVEQLIVCVDAASLDLFQQELRQLRQLGERLPAYVRLFAPDVPSTFLGTSFKRFGTHHTKAIILRYPLGLRLIILSGCIVREEDNICVDSVQWQDFPAIERRPLGSIRPDHCPFGRTLHDFVNATLQGALPPHSLAELLRWQASHDFRYARFALVTSVPGRYNGVDSWQQGYLALRRLLDREVFHSSMRGGAVVCASPSLNRIHSGFSAAMKASLTAGSCDDGGALDCASGNGWLRLVWPSADYIRGSTRGWLGGPQQTGSIGALRCKLISAHLARYEPACGSPRAVSHVKCTFRVDPDSSQVAWALVGSYNHSMAAFGTPEHGGEQLYVKSYELSCLLLPHLECAYRRSAQFGFTCTPAPGAPPPAPDPGMFGASRVVFVPYAAGAAERGRLVDLPSKERVMVLPLPIPFSLKSAPYKEGDADTPFCWGHDYGDLRDSLGRTFRQALQSRLPGESIEMLMLQQGMLQALATGGPEAKRQRLMQEDEEKEEDDEAAPLVVQHIPREHLERQRRHRGTRPSGSGAGAGCSGTPGVCSFLELVQSVQAAGVGGGAAGAAALPRTPDEQERRGLKRARQAAAAAAMQQQQQQEGPIDLTDSQ